MCRCAVALGIAASVFCVSAFAQTFAQDGLKLPDGVIHVALPPGTLHLENIVINGKPRLRLSVGKTVIDSQTLFLGDGRGAIQVEAIEEGMHWVPAKGGKGFVIDGVDTHEPGSTIKIPGDFLNVDNLKAGSVYVTSPSIVFKFGPAAKAKAKP